MSGRRASAAAVAAAVAMAGCDGAGQPDDWISVKRDDLVVGVEVTGTLKSVRAETLSPPPVPNTWQFKIARMAAEGARVKKGDAVLGFDTSELQRKMAERVAERDAAATQIAKKESDLTMLRRDLELRFAESEGKARKAASKADRPADATAGIELRLAKLDAQLAHREVDNLRGRMTGAARSARAEMAALRERLARAEGRVRELEDAIASHTLTAPRDGTVVYATGWRDEKKKLGDTCWRGEKVMEVADLGEMLASGEVDEMDVSRVTVGQRATFRLDAHPDAELAGTIKSIGDTVQRQSPKNPLKVLRVVIALDATDPVKMRPGMRFVGTVETDRARQATVVPAHAVFPRAGGPVAFRRTAVGFEPAVLKLGRRNSRSVEVLSGLQPGDAVSPTDLERLPGKKS